MTDESRPYQPHPAPVAMSQVERQDTLTIGSLCSGYGGLEMGLQAVVGGRVAWHVEYDKHPSAVLAARLPGVPNYGDVTTTDWTQVEPVDWLTAGYPCQPFSHAGKRKGSADERHLWPFVADAIGALRPRRVLLENVAGHVSLGLDAVLWDLAALGYDTTWGVVRAADAGAPHGRARVFIVAADTQCADRGAAARLSSAGGRDLGASGRVEGAAAPSGDPAVAADTAERGRRGSESEQRGLGATGRVAHLAPDSDEPGRQGSESAGRRLLPAWGATADAQGDGRHQGRAESAGVIGRPDAAERGDDAPTDTDLTGGEALSGRPRAGDAGRLQSVERGSEGVEWGAYEPAIRRWQLVTGRTAPRPTEPGRSGERLSPRFVEWLMGLPDGWVIDILGRGPALKCLGNGVVPQQAALAVRTLLSLEQVAA